MELEWSKDSDVERKDGCGAHCNRSMDRAGCVTEGGRKGGMDRGDILIQMSGLEHLPCMY